MTRIGHYELGEKLGAGGMGERTRHQTESRRSGTVYGIEGSALVFDLVEGETRRA